jgi:hypothetical protein
LRHFFFFLIVFLDLFFNFVWNAGLVTSMLTFCLVRLFFVWQVLGVILNNKEYLRPMAHLFVPRKWANVHWINKHTNMVQICLTSNAIRVHVKMEQELVLKTLAPNVQKHRCCWRKIIFERLMQNKNPLWVNFIVHTLIYK